MTTGTTKINLINLTLSYLQVAPVNDLITGPPKITALSSMYDVLKEAILQKSNWSFALKVERLARLSEPSDYPNYLYMYEIPVDCVSIWQLFVGAYQNILNYQKIGTRLYSNEPIVYLLYVFNQSESNFPASFTNYFSLQLAANASILFTQDMNIGKAIETKAALAFSDACAIDAMQHPAYVITSFPSIDIRNFG